MATTAVSSSPLGVPPSVPPITTLYTVDETSPIGLKYLAIGGAAQAGATLANVLNAPDGQTEYQEFANGTIFSSVRYGAVYLATPIFQKWTECAHLVPNGGGSVQVYLGAAMSDSFGTRENAKAAYFEHGMIVAKANGQRFVVYGMIYGHYRELNDVNGWVGLPSSDEEAAGGNGRVSRFEAADIYWRGDSGAFEVHGAIRDRYTHLGGSGGFLGFPLTDESPVLQGKVERGRFNRFQDGVIYWSTASGAFEVHGDIRNTWENEYGGALGPLGFPISNETSTPASGGRFNNFQHGVLVWHGSGPYTGTKAFFSLDLFVERFAGTGSHGVWEGIGVAGIDLYVKYSISASTGEHVVGRNPSSGTMGAGREIQAKLFNIPRVQSNLVVDVSFDGFDWHRIGSDSNLGTVKEHYSIDNLWGTVENGQHSAGSFRVEYRFQCPQPLDPSKPFRDQLFWQCINTGTPNLSWLQYTETFTDVTEPAPRPITHPFDALYYKVAYEGVASNGNCHGMCLESIYSQVGRSVFDEPIYRFGPHNAKFAEPADSDLINAINIKHGYQLGASVIDYVLGKFVSGDTHNPVSAFKESRDMFARGDYPVMALSSASLSVGGHVVRPYAWDDHDPNKWVIKVANPNTPSMWSDTDPNNVIVIDPRANTFTFQGFTPTWTGGTWSGGRMYPIPFSKMCSEPRTPFWEVFALLVAGTVLILGGDGETNQITDASGRTLFEPGRSGPPTEWSHFRQDVKQRIPNMSRVPILHANAELFRRPTPSTVPELYYMRGSAGTITHEVNSRGSGQYSWAASSPAFTAVLTVPSTAGRDIVSLENVSTHQQSVSITASAAKQVSLHLTGARNVPSATRRFEVSNLALGAGHQMKAFLANGGQNIHVENAGPDTSFDIKLQTGTDENAVSVRNGIKLEAGKSARFTPADIK